VRVGAHDTLKCPDWSLVYFAAGTPSANGGAHQRGDVV